METIGPADLRWIRVEDLKAQHSSLSDYTLPETAALYWWTRDVEQIMNIGIDESLSRIDRPLGRSFAGRAEPYFDVQVTLASRPISAVKLKKVLTKEQDVSLKSSVKWLATWATLLQRPLYIGISKNLRERINTHLKPDSRLRQYFEAADVDYMGCTIAYVPLPRPAQQADSTPDQSEEESGDQVLELLESILIRLGMPLLNRKQD